MFLFVFSFQITPTLFSFHLYSIILAQLSVLFYPFMLNYLIRFSASVCFQCVLLYFYHYITLYYFLQFSNIIIHTHVTWLASAYYCVLFVSLF